tara:strand:+ start:295 stop:1170 length:876 start_codon:yes stop_codon:yes gene_type:complete
MEKIQNNIIKKKILGVISNDAGGAELISSWLMKKKNYCNFSLSGPAKKIFKKKISIKKNLSINNTIKNSEIIITGTSVKSKREFNAIFKAKKKGILTMSFLDHWVNYKERFVRNKKFILPDYLIVTDEESKKLAARIFNKKQTKLIKIINPYLENIKKNFYKKKITIVKNNFIYFSSNLDSTNSRISDKEYLEKTISYLKKKNSLKRIKITVRRHPSESKKKFIHLKIPNVEISFDENIELIDTLKEHKTCFGFESMALVAASICGKYTYSFKSIKKKENVIPKKYISKYI